MFELGNTVEKASNVCLHLAAFNLQNQLGP